MKREINFTVRNKNEVAMHKAQLEQIGLQLAEQAYQNQLEREQVDQQINHLNSLIKINDKIVKDNETFLFAIKQNTINTIKDYKKVSKILNDVLSRNHDPDKTFVEMVDINSKINEMEEYFYRTFHMTPHQYRQIEKTKSTLN